MNNEDQTKVPPESGAAMYLVSNYDLPMRKRTDDRWMGAPVGSRTNPLKWKLLVMLNAMMRDQVPWQRRPASTGVSS